jgi:ribosome biogenesis GTPase
MKKTKAFQKKPEKLTGNEREGLLVAHYGVSAEVEDADGHIIRCHLRRNLDPVITGDRVLWLPEEKQHGVIVDYLPRKSLLARPQNNYKVKLIAANIDALVIVTAPQALFEHLLDRFIVAAEHLKITPVILFNKSDLLKDDIRDEMNARLKVYKDIGYQTIFSNTVSSDGLDELKQFLKDKTCVLVGASGVGKSSIISTFVPDQDVRVGEVSLNGQGKHTTTMTRLYHLPQGGNLIDSPGVREFGLWHMSSEEILQGFLEFKPFLTGCQYRDCKHNKEQKGCAFQQAAAEGKISPARFASYWELIREYGD